MRRVAEIIHIVEAERAAFIEGAINPDLETQKVLWLCGVRRQQYFELNDLLFMTFEYEGTQFKEDMSKMAAYLDQKNLLVKQRRKNVPLEERETTNWWAPIKRLGNVLITSPRLDEDVNANLLAMLDGGMREGDEYNNTAYDEEDWTEEFHF